MALQLLLSVDLVFATELAELLHLELVLGALLLTGGVIPVAAFRALEEDVAFLVLHVSISRTAEAVDSPVTRVDVSREPLVEPPAVRVGPSKGPTLIWIRRGSSRPRLHRRCGHLHG